MRFSGGVGRGAERKIVQNAIFQGKRHDNKILKVKFLLSRHFVVMAQAPKVIRNQVCIINTLFLQIGSSMSSLFSGTDRISLR